MRQEELKLIKYPVTVSCGNNPMMLDVDYITPHEHSLLKDVIVKVGWNNGRYSMLPMADVHIITNVKQTKTAIEYSWE